MKRHPFALSEERRGALRTQRAVRPPLLKGCTVPQNTAQKKKKKTGWVRCFS